MNNRFIVKILFTLGLLACAATAAYAVRAIPHPVTITQPDGTSLTIQVHGDEFLHWTTVGGRLVTMGEDGFYYYASFNSDGTKSISKTRATATTPGFRTSGNATVTPPPAAIAAANIKRTAAAKIGNTDLATGKHKFLVILVEFSDLKFTIDNPQEQFSRLLNEKGYSDNGGTGSSYDYYYENSGGQFDPSFDVYGPFDVGQPHAQFGDKYETSAATRCFGLACQAAFDDIDFSEYDQDGDGRVDNIFFYYAGRNAAEDGGDYTIWPHQWTLYSQYAGVLNDDGVSLNTSYACTSEYSGYGRMAGIGTFTHEFGHVIGLPDFYDADYSESGGTAPGPGSLSLMAEGSYNNEGRTPPYLSGYERYMLGWLELEEWTSSGLKELPPVQDNAAFMTPTNTDGEIYVYEYRNGEGWDRYINARGIAIYHVDRSARYASRWEDNTINNYPSHQCYDLIESTYPESAATSNGDKLFPGNSNNTVFNAQSQPAAVAWSGEATGYNLSQIKNDGTLVLSLSGGGPVIQEFFDANINVIYKAKETYSAGDVFDFMLSISNNVPTETVWIYDGQEQDTDTTSVTLTAGEHTVQARLTYSDGSTELITTVLNVQ